MTLSSRHRIWNSSPGGLRPSTSAADLRLAGQPHLTGTSSKSICAQRRRAHRPQAASGEHRDGKRGERSPRRTARNNPANSPSRRANKRSFRTHYRQHNFRITDHKWFVSAFRGRGQRQSCELATDSLHSSSGVSLWHTFLNNWTTKILGINNMLPGCTDNVAWFYAWVSSGIVVFFSHYCFIDKSHGM